MNSVIDGKPIWDLASCPFCGSANVEMAGADFPTGCRYAYCCECRANGPLSTMLTPKQDRVASATEAADGWSSRAVNSHTALVEALERIANPNILGENFDPQEIGPEPKDYIRSMKRMARAALAAARGEEVSDAE